jgi:uncharacterized protein (DUF2336 family)
LAERAELAERLSVLANAPRGLVGQLAHDDEIAIAGPLLRRSPVIDEKMLVEIASMKGQGHLLAMAERPTLSTDLTDVIVARGDRDVVRRAAGNAGAAFSENSYSTLIKRAGQDGVLTIRLGQRDDLSPTQLKDLLSGSIDVVRRRLFQVVKPERQADIKQAMTAITGPSEREERRDFMAAQRTVLKLHREGMLGEGALLNFARAFKYEESIAALSAMTGVKIETLDRLIGGDRYDPILIAGKAIDVEWATVRALILLRLGPNRTASPADIESARVNYVRLMPSTAQRVVAFWKTR